ncbi:hypothetical protein SNE40_006800 [Patella caerulea]|uniref:Ankyrin repeat protein n=1 Tax=Patella caerulea TaxID=87958 RepID=A0AAN8PSY4_PATCE
MGNRANKALLRSCEDGDYHSILSLLKRGANVEYTDSYGDTPLLKAIMNRHTNCVDVLLSNEYSRANTEHRDRTLNTPLMVAVGNLDIVRLLINNRCQLNKTNRFKESALHLAVRIGNIEVVKLLVSSCIDVTLTNKNGQTALTIATNINNKAIAKILSAKAILLKHFTPMDILLHKILDGKNDSQVDILMKRYRSQNPDDITYKILLQCAVKYRNLLLIKILFKHRIPIDASVLDIAYEYGDYGFVDILIQKGLADNVDQRSNTSMIEYAVKYGDLKSIKILFEHGIPFDASLLDIAYEKGNTGCVEFLIQKGLSDNIDQNNFTPMIEHAVENNIEQRTKPCMISYAVKYHDLKTIKKLVAHGIPFDTSVLGIAYEHEDSGCVDFLIQKGLEDKIDERSSTPMIEYAVKYNDLKSLKILLGHNIPFDVSVLDIAYVNGATGCVDLIIQKGLEDNIEKRSSTPMICYCLRHFDHAWVKKLLKHESYAYVRNRPKPFAKPKDSSIITETVGAYYNSNSSNSWASMARECFFNPGLCTES